MSWVLMFRFMYFHRTALFSWKVLETQIYALLRVIMARIENLLAFEWSSSQNHGLIGHVTGVGRES